MGVGGYDGGEQEESDGVSMSFANTQGSNHATSVLSADSIRAFIDKLKSPEYEAFLREKDERVSMAYRLVAEAHRRGFITHGEQMSYFEVVAMDGALILSPRDKHLKEFKALSEEMAEMRGDGKK